jgi:hypothetical protein
MIGATSDRSIFATNNQKGFSNFPAKSLGRFWEAFAFQASAA